MEPDVDAERDSESTGFDAMIDDAIEGLPEPFRARLGSVAIVVEDEPTPDQLASVRATGLYGLYQGVPRTTWGADQAPMPSKITIFRGPLVRAHPDPAALSRTVADVIRHEVAHHLGISDDRLRALQSGRS